MEARRELHALSEETGENLCGKPGIAVALWNEGEITCLECDAKIRRFTPKELNAAIDSALEQLV